MNATRKKELELVLNGIAEQRDKLEDIKSEEEEYRDNMSENLQGSDKYERAETAISSMEEAISNLEDAMSSLEDIE